jgi:uncharacterized protein
MLLHFSVFAGYVLPMAGLLAPILIWQLKKNEMPELDAHGKMVLNFLLSMLIYSIVAFLLAFLLVGFLVFGVLAIVAIVFPIVGGIKANNGELWNYPLMLPLFK